MHAHGDSHRKWLGIYKHNTVRNPLLGCRGFSFMVQRLGFELGTDNLRGVDGSLGD
jgi:hypothetical protein